MSNVDIFVLDSSEIDITSADVLRLLSNERKMRIQKLIPDISKHESCGVELLLCYALRSFAKPPLNISRTENGKPYIENCHRYFSLSHTNGFCMCATAEFEIGADAEKMRDISPSLQRRIMTDHDDLPSPIHTWSAKEAYLKLTGEGLQSMDAMQKLCANSNLVFSENKTAQLYQTQYRDMVLSVCSYNTIIAEIKTLSANDVQAALLQ